MLMIKKVKALFKRIYYLVNKSELSNYNLINAKRAANLIKIRGAVVLLVGANRGQDCKFFKDWGAREVHGLDIAESTGEEYQAPGVCYHIESAERMSFPDNVFNLVYCFATMEHIPRIDLAFNEMARVTKYGGFVYCVASSLWNSPNGHHMGDIFGEPWIHLRKNREEILEHCRAKGIEQYNNLPIEDVIDYMLNPLHMNQVPASYYIEVCSNLPNMKVIQNELDLHPEDMFPASALAELMAKGYTSEELRALTHFYIGQKQRLA
jgi:ubiquinone/menaquinone biosynthesis C-methylase UbiE